MTCILFPVNSAILELSLYAYKHMHTYYIGLYHPIIVGLFPSQCVCVCVSVYYITHINVYILYILCICICIFLLVAVSHQE